MSKVSVFRNLAAVCLLAGGLAACATSEPAVTLPDDEGDAYRQLFGLPGEQRIAGAKLFLAKFPDGGRKSAALRFLLTEQARRGDEAAALATAELLVAARREAGFETPTNTYNTIAATLAENDIGLDQARAYIEEALSGLPDGNSQRRTQYRATEALVFYREGDSEKAEAIQIEVADAAREESRRKPSDRYALQAEGPVLEHLALYQRANGKKREALKTMARAAIVSWETEPLDLFQQWIAETDTTEEGSTTTAARISAEIVDEFLGSEPTAFKQSLAAVFMARNGVHLERSEELARRALAAYEPDREEMTLWQLSQAQLEHLAIGTNLAEVLLACGKPNEALAALTPFAADAKIDDNYRLQQGRVFKEVGRRDEAIEAFLLANLDRPQPDGPGNPRIHQELRSMGFTDEDIRLRTAALEDSLLNYDPGVWRGEETGRVVLAELFTGSECPPCVAADKAFDYLGEYYPRSTLAILEYHVHIPRPDPMTHADTMERLRYYEEYWSPMVVWNGSQLALAGGAELDKSFVFEKHRRTTERLRQQVNGVELSASAHLSDGQVRVRVDLKPEQAPGAHINIALVENGVRYAGGNGVKVHAYVVRHLTDGPRGAPVDGSVIERTINLVEVEAALAAYLDDFEREPPDFFSGFAGWQEHPVQLETANLGIVVWLQNNETREVHQAAYAPVVSR